MGSCEFCNYEQKTFEIDSVKKAWDKLKAENQSEGYSGTIAEKDSFKVRGTCEGIDACLERIEYMQENDSQTNDKFSPACVLNHVDENTGHVLGWYFFGQASL